MHSKHPQRPGQRGDGRAGFELRPVHRFDLHGQPAVYAALTKSMMARPAKTPVARATTTAWPGCPSSRRSAR
jgi:hypothetical protein